MNPEINYMTDNARLTLSIASTGITTLFIGSNLNNPDIEKVGLFRRQLEFSNIENLTTALRSREFGGVKNPVSASSGELVRRLSIKEEGSDEVMRWAAFHTPTPPEFSAVEAQAMEVVKLLSHYPVQAIAIEVSSIPEIIERDKPVKFSLTVINPGSETIKAPHPESWSNVDVILQLTGARSDVPDDEFEVGHQKFEELSNDHIKDIEGSNIKEALITISPSDSVTYEMQVVLDWPPGQYDLQLTLVTPLFNKEGAEQIDCEIFSKTFSVKVSGDSKPEDEPEDEEDELEDDDEDEDEDEDEDFEDENIT